jgi:hypothetical protein
MFCSKCGLNLPDDAVVCYKCATPTILPFQNQPQQVQPLEPTPKSKIEKTVVQNPRPVIVKNSSGLGAAFFTVLLLALIAGGGFVWYQQNKEHEYFGFKITDKGVSFTSDGAKNPRNYPSSSSSQSPTYSAPTNTGGQTVSNSSSYNNVVTCQIVNSRKSVNGHEYCDTQDCDNDSSTSTYTIDVGDAVTLTGRRVASSLSSVGSWIEVDADGTRLFVAETKLACE